MASASSEPFLRCSRSNASPDLFVNNEKRLGKCLLKALSPLSAFSCGDSGKGGSFGSLVTCDQTHWLNRSNDPRRLIFRWCEKLENDRTKTSKLRSVLLLAKLQSGQHHEGESEKAINANMTVNDKLTCFALYFSNFCLFEVQVITAAQHWLAFPKLIATESKEACEKLENRVNILYNQSALGFFLVHVRHILQVSQMDLAACSQ